ncbi:hypothetical protein L2Y96_02880 [Luteibacter aegosomaticola]|uniref:hypothetical protein n=1 Tax=Luteibacter aegosomaticola TaxID=2911538 RepID=UPI001FFC03C2|nr:hypothetical protein [Luteibacter aegosomaticola]UPG90734.1 hypothetical protein L2Y96_02880 [Luteibacter aegosomaticola]
MSFPLRTLAVSLSFLALGIGAAHAQSATSGLGQQWPNTTDVSSNPNFHVYVFQRGSTKYVQVNDANGNVRAAVMITPTGRYGTPVGSDGSNVATSEDPLPAPASTTSQTVYTDGTTQVAVAPQADGTARVMAVAVECKNPVECSSRGP